MKKMPWVFVCISLTFCHKKVDELGNELGGERKKIKRGRNVCL